MRDRLRLMGLVLVVCALGACSDRSKVEAEINSAKGDFEFSDFKAIPREEYADAMDEWNKPFLGPRWRPVGRETVAKPQFADAKYYSIQAQRTNGYGNVVKAIRYCSILQGAVNCQVTKYLTSLEEARRGAPIDDRQTMSASTP